MKFNPAILLLVVAYAAGMATMSIGCGEPESIGIETTQGSRIESSDDDLDQYESSNDRHQDNGSDTVDHDDESVSHGDDSDGDGPNKDD